MEPDKPTKSNRDNPMQRRVNHLVSRNAGNASADELRQAKQKWYEFWQAEKKRRSSGSSNGADADS